MSGGFDQWYIRVRGRVSGPYDMQKLRGLKARGRLSRVHEVSTDSVNWQPATSVFGLFDDDVAGLGGAAGGLAAGGPTESFDLPAAGGDDWYYASDGTQLGPVSTPMLRQMLQSGSLPGDTPVWRSGQPAWMAAQEVAELGLAAPPGAAALSSRRRSGSWLTVLVLGVLFLLGGGGYFLLKDRLFRDPLVVSEIESPSAEKQITASVGLVACNWRTTDANGKREDRDFVLGAEFDGPYVKSTEGSTTVYNRLRPKESVGVFKTADLFEKSGSNFRPLPAKGMCVAFENGPSRMVHLLSGTGTCFMVTANGYALTNRHVVEDAHNFQQAQHTLTQIVSAGGFQRVEPTVWVFFGEEQHLAEIVHVSDHYDLAILKIQGKHDAQHFVLSRQVDDERLPRGHKVYVLGFPGAAQAALSEQELQARHARQEISTLVSAKFAKSDFKYSQADGSISKIAEREQVGTVVQHNADINPGNSGGPLVDRRGLVYAINTATVTGASGIHFSIAVDQLRQEIDRHIQPPPIWK